MVADGIDILAAVLKGLGILKILHSRRKETRGKRLSALDNDISPHLRQWADDAIAQVIT